MRRHLVPLAALAVVGCARPAAPPPRIVPSRPGAEAAAPPAPAAATPAPSPRVARLARLCRVWGAVRLVHPYLHERPIDWDAALVQALPRVAAASADDEEVVAVQGMLAALGDPMTRVLSPSKPPAPVASALRWAGEGALVVTLGAEAARFDAELRAALPRASSVIFDLRGGGDLGPYAELLPAHDAMAPARRHVVHAGYRSLEPGAGDFSTSFETDLPRAMRAASGARDRRIAFVVDERTHVPDVAVALARNGDAVIVAEGALAPDAFDEARPVPLVGDRVAAVRVTELDGPPPPGVYVMLAGQDMIAAAQTVLARPRLPARADVAPSVATWRPDVTYPDEAYPPLEHRLLGLFRLWNVIDAFFAYADLMPAGAWDRALEELIPRFEAAKDAREYALAIAETAARLPDSHVLERGVEIDRALGSHTLPLDVQRIEGLPVVTKLTDERAARAAGLEVGDVVVAVDGEPMDARAKRLRPYVGASNEWRRDFAADRRALAGPDGSIAVLTVRDRRDRTHESRLARSVSLTAPPAEATGPSFRKIDDDVGYVDLMKLGEGEIDAMIAALGSTKAIVLDDRGYPKPTMFVLAPRFGMRAPTTVARFFAPFVSGTGGRASIYEEQRLFPSDKPSYRGKTVMILDERTQSRAEHTALLFEAAAGTKFVGHATSGANGPVSFVCLPGAICVRFTGMAVQHADGRRLQIDGVRPDVEARPTLRGLREGRDEVLERAVAYAKTLR